MPELDAKVPESIADNILRRNSLLFRSLALAKNRVEVFRHLSRLSERTRTARSHLLPSSQPSRKPISRTQAPPGPAGHGSPKINLTKRKLRVGPNTVLVRIMFLLISEKGRNMTKNRKMDRYNWHPPWGPQKSPWGINPFPVRHSRVDVSHDLHQTIRPFPEP